MQPGGTEMGPKMCRGQAEGQGLSGAPAHAELPWVSQALRALQEA